MTICSRTKCYRVQFFCNPIISKQGIDIEIFFPKRVVEILKKWPAPVTEFSLMEGLGEGPHELYVPHKSKHCPPPIFVDHGKTFFRYFFQSLHGERLIWQAQQV